MIAVVQRVKEARVVVEGKEVGAIGLGLLILLGVHEEDTQAEAIKLAAKTAALRIMADAEGKMNLSLTDAGGQALVVSQFTLIADTRKGNRPSFIQAARPKKAIPLYELYVAELQKLTGKPVPTGIFGADMQVSLVNDGPVTIILNTDTWNN